MVAEDLKVNFQMLGPNCCQRLEQTWLVVPPAYFLSPPSWDDNPQWG